MSWRLKSCNRCLGGDLFLEYDEWRCLHCGHYYYPNDPGLVVALPEVSFASSHNRSRQRAGRFGGRNVNSAVGAAMRSDEKWWSRNQDIITHLSQGRSVQEVSTLTGKGQRQIRAARERLASISQHAEEMAEAAVAA